MEASSLIAPNVAAESRKARLARRLAATRDGGRNLFGTVALSWGLAIFLLVELVGAGGFWQVAANTRILDVFVRAGVVRLTDTGIGLIGTAPDVRFYVQANDYIDWLVVPAAIALLLGVLWLRSFQFHLIARFCGIAGRTGRHARAYLYGHGLNRLLPYDLGDIGSAAALEADGADPGRAAQVLYLKRFFVVFETVVFAAYAAAAMGYIQWLAELALPIGILAAAYFLARAVRGSSAGPPSLRSRSRTAAAAIQALDQDRVMFLKLAVLSLVSFGVTCLSFYLILQAFSTTYVNINTTFPILVAAVVGAQLARLIPITPGGLGQWEWACALALHTSGMSMASSVSATLLFTAFRYVCGGAAWSLMTLTRPVQTSVAHVLDIARGGEVALRGAPDAGRTAPPPVESAARRALPQVSLPRPLPLGLIWPRLLGLVAVGFALFALDRIAALLMRYWLLHSMGFTSVFWTNFRAGAILFAVTGLLYLAAIAAPAYVHRLDPLARRRALQIGVLVGLVAGYLQAGNYMQYLLFIYGVHWGKADPIFHHDVSLYVFKLPAIIHTLTVLWEMALLGLASSLICAWRASKDREAPPVATAPARVAARLATPWTLGMLGMLGALLAIADWLRRYGLLTKININHSIYNGAQYVDVTGIFSTLHGITIEAIVVVLGTCALILRFRRLRRNVYAPGTVSDFRMLRMRWVLAVMIPGLVLDFGFKAMIGLRIQLQVTPNEPNVQLPYIKRHIDWTNDGYDLNKITVAIWRPKEGNAPEPSLQQLLQHPAIANAPIWPGFVSYQERLLDPQHADRPFLQGTPAEGNVDTMVYGPTMTTYNQQQSLRPYYQFLDMDMTRYWIKQPQGPPQEKIFASSVRELPQFSRGPWSNMWAQRNAIFTHGYGLVANAAEQNTLNGEPAYASSGIPVTTKYPELAVSQPDVYYGEGESQMAFVNLKNLQENDHATDQGLVRSTYTGSGGVTLNPLLHRLVLGYASGQLLNVLFSKMIGPTSRALYTRQPIDRALAVAPFLYDDTRPFAVADGNHIVWMVNGMTTTNRFPYSQMGEIGDKSDRRTPFVRPTRWINYIRDSVKITIDAYTGRTHFYKWANEPIVNTYAKIYPHLFEPKSAMPAALQRQVQYPTQLAHIQMDDIWIYTHVKNPLTYFAQEDLYDDADQVFGPMIAEGKKVTFSMEPYFWMAKPGDSGLPPSSSPQQFSMSMIFTPENANNVHAIGTVYMDGKDYGRMSYLVIPKGYYFMSPQQADAAIDQDPFVAQQLGYWNRTGLQLVRGQMMPLIADGELIYVEPLFIKSDQNPLPRLKRVLVVYRDRATMAQDLPTALQYALHPNPQFPIRPGPELGGEPPFRIVSCKPSVPGCQHGKVVDQFNSQYAHDNRVSNAHP
jgi:uncharacterized membrane protein (UPF0182 family)/uncharacterized membrane protein YbhN (UPF0104 family)